MPFSVASLRPWTRLSLMIAIGAGGAGCSADTSRFSDSAFSNPFNGQTASRAEPAYAAPSAYRSAPGSQISSQPLAAPYQAPATYGSAPAYTPTYNTASYGSAPTPSPMPAYNAPSYTPPTYTPHRPEVAGMLPPPTRPELSRTTGYGANASYAPPRAQAGSAMHTVNRGETLGSIARRYDKSPDEVARANRLAVGTRVQAGQRLVIPNVQASATEAPRVREPETKLAEKPERLQKVASLEPIANARVAAPAAEPAADDKSDTSGNAAFRWPVRGRVIAGFGAKTNGQQNDGINVAVPEGTAIKSAEDGVVAYAGNELKGYGNLVLVRHANGFVTAYAHASELTVKRGDQVKRGQVLGKAGQTGNVNSPQLHFEIRKGSTPVDPMQFLGSTS